jgi:hypothetical protein
MSDDYPRIYYCNRCDRYTDVMFIRDKEEKKGTRAKSYCYKCGKEDLIPIFTLEDLR